MIPEWNSKEAKIAKKLAPIFKRHDEIRAMLKTKLDMNQIKVLGIELADSFSNVVLIACRHGFPKEKGKVFSRVCIDLKHSIDRTDSKEDLHKYTVYLLNQFEALGKILGI